MWTCAHVGECGIASIYLWLHIPTCIYISWTGIQVTRNNGFGRYVSSLSKEYRRV